MLGKRSRPISKSSILEVSGERKCSFDLDTVISPRTPLEFRFRSSRRWESKDYEGVGLGIVAAMSSKASDFIEIPERNKVSGSRKGSNKILASNPVPINISPCWKRIDGCGEILMDNDEMELSEDYTCVISHGPECTMKTIYYDGLQQRAVLNERKKDYQVSISPRTFCGDNFPTYPFLDFLNSCHLCRKKLQGKDIYMYRGEKAFCSMECRYMQMVIDEHMEKCRSEASKPSSPASSCSSRKIFFTGIVAA